MPNLALAPMLNQQLLNKGTFMKLKLISALVIILAVLAGLWYQFISIKPIAVPTEQIVAAYSYSQSHDSEINYKEVETRTYDVSYHSFDGALVNGRISFPETCSINCPVALGVSAMGRNFNRWWIDSWKGRPTVTNVNLLGKSLLQQGFVLIAIDARYHGSRKNPDRPLSSIMNDLSYFGDKSDYEAMIIDTVKDYRVLLDLLAEDERVSTSNVTIAGYSMGGQVALLTSAIDDRVSRVISIVPPGLDDKVARVAPVNLAPLVKAQNFLLVSSDDDEHASVEDNNQLFQLIASQKKDHLVFEGSHILPSNYVESVEKWLISTL